MRKTFLEKAVVELVYKFYEKSYRECLKKLCKFETVNREADFQFLCVLQALVLSEIMLFLDLQLYVGRCHERSHTDCYVEWNKFICTL